nr:reverse transcriptase domain-containing protein [Tanacetum cinerariifolium]
MHEQCSDTVPQTCINTFHSHTYSRKQEGSSSLVSVSTFGDRRAPLGPKIAVERTQRKGECVSEHLSFNDEDDRTRVWIVVTGKEIGNADLKRPFKEAVKTLLTRRIIEFAGPEFKMPANIKLYDETTNLEDHLSRFSSASNSREWPMPVAVYNQIFNKESMLQRPNEDNQDYEDGQRNPCGLQGKMDRRNRLYYECLGGHEDIVIHGRSQNAWNWLNDTPTRQLEMALESGNLNHLIKDVRQRGQGNAKGKDIGKDKVINMIRSWPKGRGNDPLIIEAVMEGYLVRRVYVDQGASVEVMFEHYFENLILAIRSCLRDTQMDLVGFAGGLVKPLGKIKLELVFRDVGKDYALNCKNHQKPNNIYTRSEATKKSQIRK